MTRPFYVLQLTCPNRPGIVSAVSTAVFDLGGNIREAQQFDDPDSGRFLARLVLDHPEDALDRVRLEAAMATLADQLSMAWRLRAGTERQRVMLMVSKFDHCLADILYRLRIGELSMDVSAIVSNHPLSTFGHLDMGGFPFFHIPVARDTKRAMEQMLLGVIDDTRTDLVVLARYMQVLSDELAAKLSGRCINIHHSFLPGFKGARPYHQAHARGVKLMGATAHYITSDLDEGPIIEQDVERISHASTAEDLVRQGRDIERRVLARALAWHLEGRVLLNGNRTVVFHA